MVKQAFLFVVTLFPLVFSKTIRTGPPFGRELEQLRPRETIALNIGKEASKKTHNPFIIEIINGSEASFGEFPFIVSLQNKSTEIETHFCGGSIFNPRTIITAAHCIEYYDESMIRVVAGTLNIYDMGENVQVRNVTQKILHAEFRQPTYMDNDIALLILDEELDFVDQYVGSIRLPEKDFHGISVAAGWGLMDELDSHSWPKELMKVKLPMYSTDECKQIRYKPTSEFVVTDNMVCAGYVSDRWDTKDIWKFDSGGPMGFKDCNELVECEFVLVGISSWTSKGKTKPAVFANVLVYTDWINENAWQMEFFNINYL